MSKNQKCPDCSKCAGDHTYLAFDDDPKRWRCHNCGAEFEPDDEGKNYSNDPSMRLQKEDEKRKREKDRMLGRMGG